MTRRRADRERIEATLPPEVLEGLAAVLKYLELPREGWIHLWGFAPFIESVAVMRLFREQQAQGAAVRRPDDACAALGVEMDAHERRLLRWHHKTWGRRNRRQVVLE